MAINLKGNDTSTYSNDLKVGTDKFFEWRQANGVGQLYTTSTNGAQSLLYGQSNFGGSTFDAFKFTCDGGARFGTDNTVPAANNVEGCAIGSGGKYISISREHDLCLELNYKGTSGPGVAFRLLNDGDASNPSVSFNYDGSASFAGEVLSISSAGLLLTSSADASVYSFNESGNNYGVTGITDSATYSGVMGRNMNTGGNLFIGLNSSGNVVYSVSQGGSVSATNAVLSLSSGDLDVGDKLKKADDALTAIKAAATDSATDLAGLKAAIVAALSNH